MADPSGNLCLHWVQRGGVFVLVTVMAVGMLTAMAVVVVATVVAVVVAV